MLKAAVRDLLPPQILARKKHGFGVPLGEWFRGELRPMLEDTLLASPRVGRRLRIEAIRALADDHFARRADRGHQLWTLMTLELWMGKHRFD